MKKLRTLLVFCLCGALVLMTACQGGEAGPSVPDEPSAPASQQSPGGGSSQSQEEAAAPTPEAVPNDPSELTILLWMTAPWEDDGYPSGEHCYSTQTEVELCRQWLYDLRAEEITALYGVEMPLDRYWTGFIGMEDSRRIVDLLRSIAPYLAPLAEGNPPTGGGWTVAIHTGDEAVALDFNGEWVTFTHEGTTWILDGTDESVQESCYEIQTILWYYGYYGRGPSDSAPVTDDVPATERYFSDDVQAIYAIDRENYVMAEVKDGYARSKWIWDELQKRVPSDGEPSGYGYLIITDEGKEYVYMNFSEEDTALNKYCQAALIAGPLHPSWLIHMTPERMVSVDIMGFDEPITDRDRLLELAEFLKEEVTVQPEAGVHSGVLGFDTPATLWYWKITFDSGVEYRFFGYDNRDGTGDFTIYTTDLDTTVMYLLDEGVAGKITTLEGRAERYDWW